MNDKIKQAVLEMLRMGANPDDVTDLLLQTSRDLQTAKEYRTKQVGFYDYVTAMHDSDFRP